MTAHLTPPCDTAIFPKGNARCPPIPRRYVICYDVPNDRRRGQLAKRLDGYGDRVQYSVFDAVLDRALFDRLTGDIKQTIDPTEDRVTVYALCGSCEKRRVRLGIDAGKELPGEEPVFIV